MPNAVLKKLSKKLSKKITKKRYFQRNCKRNNEIKFEETLEGIAKEYGVLENSCHYLVLSNFPRTSWNALLYDPETSWNCLKCLWIALKRPGNRLWWFLKAPENPVPWIVLKVPKIIVIPLKRQWNLSAPEISSKNPRNAPEAFWDSLFWALWELPGNSLDSISNA